MKITKRQLKRIIKEERDLLSERRKFQHMLLTEKSKSGFLKKAFAAVKEQGPEMVTQWLKANPDMLEGVLDDMVKDPKIKDMLKTFLSKIGDDANASADKSE